MTALTEETKTASVSAKNDSENQSPVNGKENGKTAPLTAPLSSEVIQETEVIKTFDILEIQRLLPHRYPFALVDRIIEYIPGKKAVGIKSVTINEPFFQGHFPNRPLMPGVLMIEAMAQVGGIILTQMPGQNGGLFVFAGIDKARFRCPVVPGDQLVMTLELLKFRKGRLGKLHGCAKVGDKVAAEAEMMFSCFAD